MNSIFDSSSNTFAVTDNDLHIFIYYHDTGKEKLGHIDFCIDHQLYTYGCHDPEHRSIFYLFAKGIFIICDPSSFLNANFIPGETIYDYHLFLTDTQNTCLQEHISDTMKKTVPWHCAYERSLPFDDNDYASKMFIDTGCTFYESHSKYNKYNAIHNNCVSMVSNTLDCILPGYHHLIHTPSSYQHFLDTLISSKHIDVQVYKNEDHSSF